MIYQHIQIKLQIEVHCQKKKKKKKKKTKNKETIEKGQGKKVVLDAADVTQIKDKRKDERHAKEGQDKR